jgi:aminomethyltransferase
MNQRTSLYQKHLESGAKIVNFSGWDMPMHYGSQIEEHNCVRTAAGIFDVSHMTVIDVDGGDATAYLQRLLANNVTKLQILGSALYSAMLDENGGVLDDLIVYKTTTGYRLVVNCATREKDLKWMAKYAEGFSIAIQERSSLGILAVHGPLAIPIVCNILEKKRFLGEGSGDKVRILKNFQGIELKNWFVARTGYTGEKGLEIILPSEQAPSFWDALLVEEVKPVGLGARDTLRLEAGMNLYGSDMDENTSPLSANMDRTIAWEPGDREFIGRGALKDHQLEQKVGNLPILVGLVLEARGVLRNGQKIICTQRSDKTTEGIVTSGSFSPTLNHSIALARIPANTESCQVLIRGNPTPVRIVEPGFVRFGKRIFK